jgi:tetrahydromethanopterin S-methyltransferase subunit A
MWFMQDVIVGTGAAVAGGASSVGLGAIIANRLSNPLIEFIPFVGCFAILLAPLFIMRLFKGFLP